MSRTVRGSFGQEEEQESSRSSSGRKSRKNVERKPTFLSFFKVIISNQSYRDKLIRKNHNDQRHK